MNTDSFFEALRSTRTPFDKEKDYSNLYLRKGTINHTVISTNSTSINKLGANTLIVKKTESNERKLIEFHKYFDLKWSSKSSFFSEFPSNLIKKTSQEVFLKLDGLKIRNLHFTLTSDESVFFQGNYEDKSIYFEVFFDEECDNSTDVVLNVYDKNNKAKGFSGSINKMVNRLMFIGVGSSKNKTRNTTDGQYCDISFGSLATNSL